MGSSEAEEGRAAGRATGPTALQGPRAGTVSALNGGPRVRPVHSSPQHNKPPLATRTESSSPASCQGELVSHSTVFQVSPGPLRSRAVSQVLARNDTQTWWFKVHIIKVHFIKCGQSTRDPKAPCKPQRQRQQDIPLPTSGLRGQEDEMATTTRALRRGPGPVSLFRNSSQPGAALQAGTGTNALILSSPPSVYFLEMLRATRAHPAQSDSGPHRPTPSLHGQNVCAPTPSRHKRTSVCVSFHLLRDSWMASRFGY